MKIINTESGKPYQLNPGTELSIERTNPFFNDYGEQTLPVSLPDSDYNRTLLGNPGMTQRKDKVQMVDASIQDGNFYSVCRQAILSVTQGESIETSFYMNEGSFYSRLEDVYITEIFQDETIPGISTIDQAIEYMRQLWLNCGDEQFACFQVQVDDDGEKRNLNSWDRRNDYFGTTFYNAVDRVMTYKNVSVYSDTRPGGRVTHTENMFIPAGFYITPFIKANYVLKRLFAHFGYSLTDNFFTRTPQFKNLVFLNNVADAIVLGKIYIAQLVPNVTCKKILDLFRKKFCCEFIVNEFSRTVTIMTMNEIIDNLSCIDMSEYIVGKPKIEYPVTYQQIKLNSSGVTSSVSDSSVESLPMIRTLYPTAQFSPERGQYIRTGFQYNKSLESPEAIEEIVADTSLFYYQGGNNEVLNIDIPDCIPSTVENGSLYIGQVSYLNSSLRIGTVDDNQLLSYEENTSDNTKLMLAFAYRNNGYTGGTVTSYGSNGHFYNESYQKIGDYALINNGDDGIFERFYRKYDTLLRNSMNSVEVSMLPTISLKQNLKSTDKVIVFNNEYLINSITFSLGNNSKLVSMKLMSMQLYEPVLVAKQHDDIVPPLIPTGYKWVPKYSSTQTTQEEYEKSNYKELETPMVFPPQPTSADVGKKCFLRKVSIYLDADHAPRPLHGETWWYVEYWLEAVAE